MKVAGHEGTTNYYKQFGLQQPFVGECPDSLPVFVREKLAVDRWNNLPHKAVHLVRPVWVGDSSWFGIEKSKPSLVRASREPVQRTMKFQQFHVWTPLRGAERIQRERVTAKGGPPGRDQFSAVFNLSKVGFESLPLEGAKWPKSAISGHIPKSKRLDFTWVFEVCVRVQIPSAPPNYRYKSGIISRLGLPDRHTQRTNRARRVDARGVTLVARTELPGGCAVYRLESRRRS